MLHRADIVFRPGRNEFNGRVSAQLQVQAIRAACGEEDGENTGPDEFFLRCLQEMVPLSAKKTDYPSAQPAMRPEYLLKDRLDRVDPSREALGNVYRALRGFSGSRLWRNSGSWSPAGQPIPGRCLSRGVFQSRQPVYWGPGAMSSGSTGEI